MLAFSKYLFFRIIFSLLTLLAVSFLVYAIIEMMPGDYAERYLFKKWSSTGGMIYQEDIDNVFLMFDFPRLQYVR